MRIRPLVLSLLAATAVVLILPLQSLAITTDQLRPTTRTIDGLPYQAYEVTGPILPLASGKTPDGYLLFPPGPDGIQRVIRHRAEGLTLSGHDGHSPLVIDQLNIPGGYIGDTALVGLAPYATGSAGPDEIAVTARHAEGDHWRVWAADIEAQLLRGDLTLPTFPERRHDGRWDGAYWPVGALPMAGRTSPALLLICDVEHDVHGRGLLAVDPLAGQVLWRVMLDARLDIRVAWIGDLEGDGASEVVVASRAVNNLDGERLYGASDDSSRVFVFDAEGTLRWQRALNGPGSSCNAAVVDLDADGALEVVAVASGPRTPRGRLVAYTADGVPIDEVVTEYDMTTQVVALPATPDREALLVVGDHGRYIRIVALRDGVLQEIRRTDREGGHIVAVNVLPDAPGPQLAIIGRSELHLLDLDLRRVGGLTLNAERRPLTVESWQANPSTRLLLVADGLSPPFAFARAPRSFHPAWFAGGAAAVASLAGVAWRRQRLRRRAGQVETDPVILRELRLQLLGRLSKGGHEKIGALKSLRRLVWRLEAEAVSHADTGAAASEPARQRVDKAVSVVQADAAPRLRELLVLGHRTGVPGHLLAMARDLLDELATLLTAAGAGEAAYTDLHHQLAALAEELEAVLQRLRRHVEHHFRSDLAATVERVLAAQRDTLTATAVSVTVTPYEAAPEPQVAIDVQDLEFVVDNLVGNAIRAMDGASRRELRLDWSVSGERVLLTVADSGCGIAPDDWDAIFADDWSTRPGGGYGLARSRRELATYGGSLRVVRSAPGQGTTFLMILPMPPDLP